MTVLTPTKSLTLFEVAIDPWPMFIHLKCALYAIYFVGVPVLSAMAADLKAHVKNTTSQYNLPPNNLDLKYPCAREAMRNCFDDEFVQRNIDLDLNIIAFYHHELSAIE